MSKNPENLDSKFSPSTDFCPGENEISHLIKQDIDAHIEAMRAALDFFNSEKERAKIERLLKGINVEGIFCLGLRRYNFYRFNNLAKGVI